MKEFEGKVAIITGAGSGIGRATALLFAEKGAKVVAADLSDKRSSQVVAEIQEKGGEALFVQTNVADLSSVNQMIASCLEHYGQIDILVNNAGIGG
nr:SDR family NAD(P)-dependent oxidoreductase [Saprospiraceae bacterium]